jgi:hypothetical protein
MVPSAVFVVAALFASALLLPVASDSAFDGEVVFANFDNSYLDGSELWPDGLRRQNQIPSVTGYRQFDAARHRNLLNGSARIAA